MENEGDVDSPNEPDVEPQLVPTSEPTITPTVAVESARQPVEALRPWVICVHEKEFATDPETGSLQVSFADLNLQTILNMRKVPPNAVDYFPDWLNKLDGKRVRIRGYMFPTFKEEVKLFGFVRNPWPPMHFQIPIRPDEMMTVLLKDGTTTSYLEGQPIDVEGTLHIKPWISSSGDKIIEIFRIHDARVMLPKSR